MIRSRSFLVLLIIFLLGSCNEKKESPLLDFSYDFQPIAIGNYWVYSVEEVLYFGENDSEENSYFLRDFIRGSYLNEAGELVFVVERSTSVDQSSWNKLLDYTLQVRNNSLIRTIENQSLVTLIFPPKQGQVWNAKIYQANGEDDFEVETLLEDELKILQEDLDDEITIRDIRYEIYRKGTGLSEKYDEVVTYCSRNDCLGQQIIDGGYKRHLNLLQYVES